MTGENERTSERAIELCRRVNRDAATRAMSVGITREDATIASIYSAFDLAAEFVGGRIAGLEWLRTALDVIEQQLMAEETLQ